MLFRNYQIYKLIGEPDGISEKIDIFVKEYLTDLNLYKDNQYPKWSFFGKSISFIVYNYPDNSYDEKLFYWSDNILNRFEEYLNVSSDDAKRFFEDYIIIILKMKVDVVRFSKLDSLPIQI
jgi:hypothetical protein